MVLVFYSPKLVKQDTRKWKPPPEEFVKINLDGAYYPESGMGGWGYIARAPDGDILFAAAGPLCNLSEPLQAKSNAFLKAVDLSENFGMGKVIFEIDCLNLKQTVCSDASERATLGALFREAKYRLRLGFIEYRVEFSPETITHQCMCWQVSVQGKFIVTILCGS